ncbi:MAG: hypothetical protein U5K28_09995 [Halobacteriales archaeon]|nr:hypothetical protein [Halobacteriales archaeon]
MSAEPEPATAAGDDYSGLLTAFPYAFRHSDSRLFRLYVVGGGLFAALLGIVFALAAIISISQSAGLAVGGTDAFVRTFVVIVGFIVVVPVVAPVLLVARRHRRQGSKPAYDRALAVAGIVYLLSLYLLLVASIPETFTLDGETITRPPASGLFGPVLAVLYAIPPITSPVIPILTATAGWFVHRRYR